MAMLKRTDRPGAMKLIVLYKFAKAAAEAACAFLFFRYLSDAGDNPFLLAAAFSRRHLAGEAAMFAAKRLFHGHPYRFYYTDLALVLDGAITAVEGSILYAGFSWAPMFVVVVTGLPLPIELFELVRRPRVSRAAFFCANALVVAYLTVRARRAAHSRTVHAASMGGEDPRR